MSRYMIICRLRWPAFLLLTGVIALLDQAHILSWGRAWPLYLILWGVLALAERATLASEQPPVNGVNGYPYGGGYPSAYPATGYPGQTGAYPGVPSAGPVASSSPVPPASTSIVPVQTGLEVHNDVITGKEEEGR